MISVANFEVYLLSDVLVTVDGKYERLGEIKVANPAKVPKEEIDVIEVRLYNGDIVDFKDFTEDEKRLILDEVSMLDVLAYNQLNEEFYHYRNY